MAVIDKSKVSKPVLPKETVAMPSLQGDVVVTGLLLKDRINLFAAQEATMAMLLASTVVDANGDPVFTEEEWQVHGASHFAECIDLYKVAKRLSGLDAEVAEKNS